ncbi:DUF2695 domain-containing protein [Spongisporangium articulatum]|uniref:DUF2695 domain-containing protein n=1 Tax=Spongisporangium articulatum TaxID=3362603 RepID=A0ABW8ASX3_9ACTN
MDEHAEGLERVVTAYGAEDYLRQLSHELLGSPRPECLACYVFRMVNEFGCDHTRRFTGHWRQTRARHATGLERRLDGAGAFCDCRLFRNGWRLDAPRAVHRGERPACPGVGPRSAQPCALWCRIRRPPRQR